MEKVVRFDGMGRFPQDQTNPVQAIQLLKEETFNLNNLFRAACLYVTVYLGECHRKKHNNDPKQIKRLLMPSIKSFSHNKTQRVSNLFFGKVQTAQVTSNYIILIEHQSKGRINSSK